MRNDVKEKEMRNDFKFRIFKSMNIAYFSIKKVFFNKFQLISQIH